MMQVVTRRRTPAASCGMLSAKQGSVEMRKITFAVYNPPKEGLPYLAAIIAPNGAVAAVGYRRCDPSRFVWPSDPPLQGTGILRAVSANAQPNNGTFALN
jgi:hypothetical protein